MLPRLVQLKKLTKYKVHTTARIPYFMLFVLFQFSDLKDIT